MVNDPKAEQSVPTKRHAGTSMKSDGTREFRKTSARRGDFVISIDSNINPTMRNHVCESELMENVTSVSIFASQHHALLVSVSYSSMPRILPVVQRARRYFRMWHSVTRKMLPGGSISRVNTTHCLSVLVIAACLASCQWYNEREDISECNSESHGKCSQVGRFSESIPRTPPQC